SRAEPVRIAGEAIAPSLCRDGDNARMFSAAPAEPFHPVRIEGGCEDGERTLAPSVPKKFRAFWVRLHPPKYLWSGDPACDTANRAAIATKTDCGLLELGAAPSVALATLAIAFWTQGPFYAAIEGRSMMIGAIALCLYSIAVRQLMKATNSQPSCRSSSGS